MGAKSYGPLAGKFGRVKLGSTNQPWAGHWDCPITGDHIPMPGFESAGWMEGLVGVLTGEVNIEGFIDAGTTPSAANVKTQINGWMPGQRVTVDLLINQTLGVGYQVDILLTSQAVAVAVKEGVSFKIKGMSDGAITVLPPREVTNGQRI